VRKHFNEFERPVSRVRSVFARRIKSFEAKHEGTFNANRSRQSRLPLIKEESPKRDSFLLKKYHYRVYPNINSKKKFYMFLDGYE